MLGDIYRLLILPERRRSLVAMYLSFAQKAAGSSPHEATTEKLSIRQ